MCSYILVIMIYKIICQKHENKYLCFIILCQISSNLISNKIVNAHFQIFNNCSIVISFLLEPLEYALTMMDVLCTTERLHCKPLNLLHIISWFTVNMQSFVIDEVCVIITINLFFVQVECTLLFKQCLHRRKTFNSTFVNKIPCCGMMHVTKSIFIFLRAETNVGPDN